MLMNRRNRARCGMKSFCTYGCCDETQARRTRKAYRRQAKRIERQRFQRELADY